MPDTQRAEAAMPVDTSREAVERVAHALLCGPLDVVHDNVHEAAHMLRALVAERDAARAELSAFKAAHDIGAPQDGYREMIWREAAAHYEQEDDGLRAENARLREALERIASRAVNADEMGVKPGAEYWCSVAEERLQIARAALGGGAA